MNARGWKTTEPGSDRLPPEQPEMVKYIGKTLQSRGLSTQEIAEITGFDSSEDTNPFLPAPTRRRLSAV
jgi:hypothetical protein